MTADHAHALLVIQHNQDKEEEGEENEEEEDHQENEAQEEEKDHKEDEKAHEWGGKVLGTKTEEGCI